MLSGPWSEHSNGPGAFSQLGPSGCVMRHQPLLFLGLNPGFEVTPQVQMFPTAASCSSWHLCCPCVVHVLVLQQAFGVVLAGLTCIVRCNGAHSLATV